MEPSQQAVRYWPALDARALFALWRLNGSRDKRAEAIWIAFEEGWAAGDRAARYGDLQEPGPLLYECQELFAQWCDGVIDSWTDRLETEAEGLGCECEDSTNYVCCNHRECPLHRQEATERFATWLEARADKAAAPCS